VPALSEPAIHEVCAFIEEPLQRLDRGVVAGVAEGLVGVIDEGPTDLVIPLIDLIGQIRG